MQDCTRCILVLNYMDKTLDTSLSNIMIITNVWLDAYSYFKKSRVQKTDTLTHVGGGFLALC